MKFLEIDDTTTLSDVSSRVGRRNVGTLLNVNNLSRSRDIGNSIASYVLTYIQVMRRLIGNVKRVF